MTISAKENGIENIFLPVENADEAAIVSGINVYPAKTINDVVNHLNGIESIEKYDRDKDNIFKYNISYDVDFSDVKGQQAVKRALEVAASGGHNLIMVGGPGCGKTMMARRLPTILPSMTFEEALEVTKIYSIAGVLPERTPLITQRPFRAPHYTISSASLIGGEEFQSQEK